MSTELLYVRHFEGRHQDFQAHSQSHRFVKYSCELFTIKYLLNLSEKNYEIKQNKRPAPANL